MSDSATITVTSEGMTVTLSVQLASEWDSIDQPARLLQASANCTYPEAQEMVMECILKAMPRALVNADSHIRADVMERFLEETQKQKGATNDKG